MSVFNISSRYAVALLEIAEEKNNFEQVSSEMEFVFNTFKKSRELRNFIVNPIVKLNQKIEIMDEIFKDKVGSEVQNFIHFVLNKSRESVLYDILRRFLELRDVKIGVVNADVSSSVELTEEQKASMKSRLEKFTSKNVRMSYKLNPALIGGFFVKIGDTVYDASVSHQLAVLKNNLLTENY